MSNIFNINLSEINKDIANSWDRIVYTRSQDIIDKTDSSYVEIIEPWVVNETIGNTYKESRILDIGCGCGHLTNLINTNGRKNICGIDISKESIKLAQNTYRNISFDCQDIYTAKFEYLYDICLAVMVLNNMPEIKVFFKVLFSALNIRGKSIIVLPHPCFWPNKHINNQNFEYMREDSYKIKFATKGRKDYNSFIRYFHRPIESYLDTIINSGFSINKVVEFIENDNNTNPDIIGIIITKQVEDEIDNENKDFC